MTAWDGPYLISYAPTNLTNKKSVSDHGRTVDTIKCLDTDMDWEGGGFGTGRAIVPLKQRDNYPLVEKGDIVVTYSNMPTFLGGTKAIIAIFIVEDVDVDEQQSGDGNVVYSGSGIAKELQRKILRAPYVSNTYSGTSGSYTNTYVFLDAAHQQPEDYYNGGIIEIVGRTAEITSYSTADNRAYVQNWSPSDPTSGSSEAYTIYHGATTNDLTIAIANSQTGWVNDRAGTAQGTFKVTNGRKCIDVLSDISEETGWIWATNITDDPLRMLFWFDSLAAPVSSGLQIRQHSDLPYATFRDDVHTAPVISCQRTDSNKSGVTRLICSTGDGLTLVGINPANYTIPAGFSLNTDESMIIYDTAEVGLSVYEIIEQSEQFREITAASDTNEAKAGAIQQLIDKGCNFLRERNITAREYSVKTITRRNASIGQSVYLKYLNEILGETRWSVDDNLWVRSFNASASVETGGVRYVTYKLATQYQAAPRDGNTALAQRLTRMGGGSSGNITITGGGGGGTPHVHDHGSMTNLDQDHHLRYLLEDGTRPLTGDLVVTAGKTIDTVDISDHYAQYQAHIIDPDAHHTPGSNLPIYGGENIEITNVIAPGGAILQKLINLAWRVEIQEELRVHRNAIFVMYDHAFGQYRQLRITERDGQPIWEFADPSDWPGTILQVKFEQRYQGVDVETAPAGSLIEYRDTTVPSEGYTIVSRIWTVSEENTWGDWEVVQETFDHTFWVAGIHTVTLTIEERNVANDVNTSYKRRQIHITE